MLDLDRLRAAYLKARDDLLAERTPNGHWIGELSSSALSTATAVSAISVVRRNAVQVLSTQYSVPSTPQACSASSSIPLSSAASIGYPNNKTPTAASATPTSATRTSPRPIW